MISVQLNMFSVCKHVVVMLPNPCAEAHPAPPNAARATTIYTVSEEEPFVAEWISPGWIPLAVGNISEIRAPNIATTCNNWAVSVCSNLVLVNDHELLVLSWNEHLDTQNVCIQQYSMLHEHLDDLDADQCAMR